jgi:opacity protein-like surface antigen
MPAPPPVISAPAYQPRFVPVSGPPSRAAPWDPDPRVNWRPYGPSPGAPGPGGQPPASWEGFYFGGSYYRSWANINRTWNETDHWVAAGTSFGQDSTGWLASGLVGYNLQVDRMTIGIEASMLATKFTQSVVAPADSTVGSDPISANYKLKSLYMVAGRAGLPVADFLPYFRGGWAFGEIETYTRDSVVATGALLHDATTSKFQNGPIVGFGVDYMATPNLIIGMSYDYVRLLDTNHFVAQVNDNGQPLAAPVHASSDMNAAFHMLGVRLLVRIDPR